MYSISKHTEQLFRLSMELLISIYHWPKRDQNLYIVLQHKTNESNFSDSHFQLQSYVVT